MDLLSVIDARPLGARRGRRAILALAVASLGAPLALGAPKDWSNAAGGDWQDGGNWSPAGAPGGGDDANFNLASVGGYSLTFSSAASSTGLSVRTDRPTLSLGGTQALTLAGAVAVAPTSGDVGVLSLIGGGTLVSSGAVSHLIGGAGAAGTLSISGAGSEWMLQNDLGIAVGAGQAASGTILVSGGAAVTATDGITVADNGGLGVLQLSGGTVTGGSGGIRIGHQRLVIAGEDQGPSNGYLGASLGTTSVIDSATIGSDGGAGLAEISGTLSATTLDIGRGNQVIGVDTFGSQGDLSLLDASSSLATANVTIGSMGGTGNFIQYDGNWSNTGSVHVGADSLGNGGTGSLAILKGNASITGTLKVWNTPGTEVQVLASSPSFVSSTLTTGAVLNDASFTVEGGVVSTGSFSGTGTLSVSGISSTLGTITADHFRQDALSIGDGGRAIVRASGGANGVSHLNSLSIATDGSLDLNDNDLIVEYTGPSPFTQIKAWVLDGYSGAVDPSKRGIVSTAGQQAGGAAIHALFDNALLGAEDWNGQTITANSIVGKYTYFGDMNLDGQVTGDDYTVIDANLNTTPAVGLEWLSGDANLDGMVTGDDYTVIDANLGLGNGNPLGPSELGRAAPSLITSAVPEPAGIFMLAASGASLLVRRRRSRV